MKNIVTDIKRERTGSHKITNTRLDGESFVQH